MKKQIDTDQLTLLGGDFGVRDEARLACEKIKEQLLSRNMNYDVSQIILEHRAPQKGQPYDTIKMLDQPCMHFKGKKTLTIEVPSKLIPIFEQFGIPMKKLSTNWGKAPYDESLIYQLEHQSELSAAIFEAFLYAGGDTFGCCSSYVECSNAKACLKKDIMFAGKCAYRLNLKAGRIFYGENKNYP